jgi:hypothetical protein
MGLEDSTQIYNQDKAKRRGEADLERGLEARVQRTALEARRSVKSCDDKTIERLASTVEGDAALLKIFECSRRLQAQFTKLLGGGSAVVFAYAGLAATAGDAGQTASAMGIGSAGLAATLAALVFEQIDLAQKLDQRLSNIKHRDASMTD